MPSNRRKRVWGRKFPLDKSHFITEMRNAKWWCGAKNKEAPQSFDSASRRRHLERSREISLAERSAHHLRYFDHRLLLIPNP